MQLRQAIPGIWVFTTADAFNAMRPGGGVPFLSPADSARVERIRQARLLFDGKHREYFLDERRTQFDFPEVRVGNDIVRMYLTYNVLALISTKSADLLFGQEPLLRADDATQQDYLAKLVERTNLPLLLQAAALDCSYEGECFLESCAHDNETYVRQVPTDEIFPIGPMLPDGQYGEYVRYAVENVGTDQQPVHLLLETRYLPGKITRVLWQLGGDGKRMKRVALAAWPHKPIGGQGVLLDVEPTGVARNTITWIPNLLVRGKAVSDYDGAIDLQDKINSSNTQIGRVLAKHSDPKLAVPEDLFDPQGNLPTAHDVLSFRDKLPAYIVWNAELEMAFRDRAFAVNALLIKTETSPVLLGLKEGAAPDAYKKVRLEAFNSITKAQRKSILWKAGIRRAVTVAQDLENALPGKVQYERYPIAVELRDGIPADELDQANRQQLLVSAHLMSRRRALTEQLNDPAAVDAEMAEIDQDVAKAAPTVFGGSGFGGVEPGELPTNDDDDDDDEQHQAA
jgi:hypothetical protein